MKPRVHKGLLLAAALGSLAAHWLVLTGVDLDTEPGSGTEKGRVMVATLPLPPAAPGIQKTAPPPAPRPTPPTRTARTEPTVAPESQPSRDLPEDRDGADTATEQPASAQAPQRPVIKDLDGQIPFEVFLGDGDGEPLAQMTHTLRIQNGRYEMTSRGEALGLLALMYSGLLTQHSSGVFDSTGFMTRLYSEQKGKKPESRVTVDPSGLLAQFSHGGTAPIAAQALQDRLSVIYQLALRVRAEEGMLESIDFPVLSTSALENWRFARTGTETIRIHDQSVSTLHYRRLKTEGTEKTGIDVWIDTQGDGWPVQIRLTDKKGMVITQRRATLRSTRTETK